MPVLLAGVSSYCLLVRLVDCKCVLLHVGKVVIYCIRLRFKEAYFGMLGL